jgi:hypothetical protein
MNKVYVLQLASNLSDLSSVPVGHRLGITGNGDRIKGLQLPDCSFSIINQPTNPFAVLFGGSHNLFDSIYKDGFVTSCGCVAE